MLYLFVVAFLFHKTGIHFCEKCCSTLDLISLTGQFGCQAFTGKPRLNHPGPALDPIMPSDISTTLVNPAVAKMRCIWALRPPVAQIRAILLLRLPPNALARFLINPASCMDIANAGFAKPVCFHSPRVRISTKTISPFAAAANTAGADILLDEACTSGGLMVAIRVETTSATVCRRVKFML